MAWTIEISESAAKTLKKLDRPVAQRIIKFLRERVASDPKAIGDQLQGNLSEFWRYRVGAYRIFTIHEEAAVKVIVVKIGHRGEVYR